MRRDEENKYNPAEFFFGNLEKQKNNIIHAIIT